MAVIDSKEALALIREGTEIVHRLLSERINDPKVRQAAYQWLIKAIEKEIAEEKR